MLKVPASVRLFSALILPAVAVALASCGGAATQTAGVMTPSSEDAARATDGDARVLLALDGDTLGALRLSDEEWAERLSDEAYYVLREDGTERAGTSPLLGEKRAGVFVCAACELPLFSSETKYESGTGWPSFYAPLRDDHVVDLRDNTFGMVRTENRCARCDGHLGHVFSDGPQPTGLRYCMNGDALAFVAGATQIAGQPARREP